MLKPTLVVMLASKAYLKYRFSFETFGSTFWVKCTQTLEGERFFFPKMVNSTHTEPHLHKGALWAEFEIWA